MEGDSENSSGNNEIPESMRVDFPGYANQIFSEEDPIG